MAESYWKRVHQRAVRDARHALSIESGERVVLGIVISIVGIAVIWLAGGHETALSETLVRLTASLLILAVFPLVYCWKLIGTPARLDSETNLALTEATRGVPALKIKEVRFSKDNPHQLAVEVVISNPGDQTVIFDWVLSIKLPDTIERQEYRPLRIQIGHTRNAFGGFIVNDLQRSPLMQGAREQGTVWFQKQETSSWDGFNVVGALFNLSAKDVRANLISDTYILKDVAPS